MILFTEYKWKVVKHEPPVIYIQSFLSQRDRIPVVTSKTFL